MMAVSPQQNPRLGTPARRDEEELTHLSILDLVHPEDGRCHFRRRLCANKTGEAPPITLPQPVLPLAKSGVLTVGSPGLGVAKGADGMVYLPTGRDNYRGEARRKRAWDRAMALSEDPAGAADYEGQN